MFNKTNKCKSLLFTTFFISFLVAINLINVYGDQYYEGYNDGYFDSQHGLRNKFRESHYPRRHYRNRQNRNNPYRGPNYDEVEEDYRASDSNRENGENGHKLQNYANLFTIDEEELKRKAEKLSETCRTSVRPNVTKCVEKAANKWRANIRTQKLDANACKALWDIICCATDLSKKRCSEDDLKILEEGFSRIQNILESKDCGANPRSSVKCQ